MSMHEPGSEPGSGLASPTAPLSPTRSTAHLTSLGQLGTSWIAGGDDILMHDFESAPGSPARAVQLGAPGHQAGSIWPFHGSDDEAPAGGDDKEDVAADRAGFEFLARLDEVMQPDEPRDLNERSDSEGSGNGDRMDEVTADQPGTFRCSKQKCPQFNRVFGTRKSLSSHQTNWHVETFRITISDEGREVEVKRNADWKFPCPRDGCSKTFAHRPGLASHVGQNRCKAAVRPQESALLAPAALDTSTFYYPIDNATKARFTVGYGGLVQDRIWFHTC